MKIREVNENKKQFISLLLLADEQESMVDLGGFFACAMSHEKPDEMEYSLVNAMSRELILKSMVEKLRDFYDFIIIECILRI